MLQQKKTGIIFLNQEQSTGGLHFELLLIVKQSLQAVNPIDPKTTTTYLSFSHKTTSFKGTVQNM